MPDKIELIRIFNHGRNKKLLRVKYKNMRKDPFKFFRGTAHLFYADIPSDSFLYKSPNVWICGDMHFENFGSFRGDNGLVYFDLNDFDEALLAPCLLDIARFLVSLLLITELLDIKYPDAIKLCNIFLDAYCQSLVEGNSRVVEKESARGLIKDLLKNVQNRRSFIKDYTCKVDGARKFDLEHKSIEKLNHQHETKTIKIIQAWNEKEETSNLFQIMDWGYHVKGKGSLGHDRYILLVKKHSNNKCYLVDLKKATPSCASPYVSAKQPNWKNDAERIVEIQKRVQGTSPALLYSIEVENESYVLREYQASEDKIRYDQCKKNISLLENVVVSMAQIAGWGQLQSGGRQGSAITDDLISFGNNKGWREKLLNYVDRYFKVVKKDYQEFSEAFDKGNLSNHK
jgi:uncharacterized protein (DUF2252 family)